MVTSRETRRWVIPKGWPMKGRKPRLAAAREAFEEAGVVGRIDKTPLGAYHYVKQLKNGAQLMCRVEVFPMKVQRQRKRWPEQHQRTAHWFSAQEAAEAVHEPELQALIEAFALAARRGEPKGALDNPGPAVDEPVKSGAQRQTATAINPVRAALASRKGRPEPLDKAGLLDSAMAPPHQGSSSVPSIDADQTPGATELADAAAVARRLGAYGKPSALRGVIELIITIAPLIAITVLAWMALHRHCWWGLALVVSRRRRIPGAPVHRRSSTTAATGRSFAGAR